MKTTFTLVLIYIYSLQSMAQFSAEHIITTNANSARYVHSVDINGDGFIDVVMVSVEDNTIAWYENLDGLGNFGEKRVIREFILEYQFISSADIDGDGDMDILSTTLFDDLVIWFENLDGLGDFSGVKIINSNRDLPVTVFGADLDNDGDIDAFSASKFDGVIAWYENVDGLGDFSIEHIISTQASSTTWASAADIDNDGDIDILATAAGNNQSIFWYENDGLGNFSEGNLIVNNLVGSYIVISDDVDGDGDMDVLSVEFGGDTIAWYENLDGLGNFGVKNIITTDVDAPFQIVTADIDNDGDPDVVLVSGADDKIAWHENDGLGNFGEQQIIALTAVWPRSIDVADFDGDGYVDVVSASIFDDKIAWYKNLTYLGINDNTLNIITLSPNPTKGLVTINAPNTIIKSIEVYDMLGKQVLVENNNSHTINLSNLQNGLYLIKVETEQGSLIKKIIKE